MSSSARKEIVYHVEGFVKVVSKDEKGVKFSLEAVAPYLFESKEKKLDGSIKRKILLVADDESQARIYAESVEFKIGKNEFTALLIAKASHMKVRLTVNGKDREQNKENPLVVSKLEML